MADLDPHMAEILRLIAQQDLPPYEGMAGAEARAAAEERNRFWNEGNPAVGQVRELSLPGPGGPLRLRLYEPDRRRTPFARRPLPPWRWLGDLLARYP